jgi:double-stranded uracil-DNA glycosylase
MAPSFTRAQLESFQGTTVPDLLGPRTRLLFVGINPGLWTAAVQAHFARRGNRFYPALFAAGITDHVVDASTGYTPADEAMLLEKGLGITNLVPLATARADELTPAQLIEGGARLRALVRRVQPAVVAVLGVTAYRTAFGQPKARTGRQPEGFERAHLWVLPNPSGLNAHVQLPALGEAFREVAEAAGVGPLSPPAP